MALVLTEIYKVSYWVLNDVADKRVENWFLMRSVLPILWISLIYLAIILKVGPAFMKDRKPFNLEKLMILYNGLQVLACAYIVVEGIRSVWSYNCLCAPVDYTDSPKALAAANVAWTYFIVKVTDLLDTVFFILRKKEKQITFLHVYHHWGMVPLSWIFAKFVGGGATLYIIIFNSFVHVVMYTYYLLTALDEKSKKNLWWKKYITQLQLVQFMVLGSQHINMLFSGCTYPLPLLILYICQSTLFLGLFGEFYITAYIKPKLKARRTSALEQKLE